VGRAGFGHEWLASRLLAGTDNRLTLVINRDSIKDPTVTSLPELNTFTEEQVRGWFLKHRLLLDEEAVMNLDVLNRVSPRLSTPDLFFDAVCEAANISRSVIDRR